MIRRMFGRITPERVRTELAEESKRLAAQFRVLEIRNQAIGRRAVLNARHSAEMAEHYESVYASLVTPQPFNDTISPEKIES